MLFSAKTQGSSTERRDLDEGRHVDDGVVAAQPAGQPLLVTQIALDEARGIRDERAEALREVVEDGDLVLFCEQRPRDRRADKAGTASDEYAH